MICNEASEIEIFSTGSDVFIEFVANSEWPGQGFRASYEFQSMDEESGNLRKKNTMYINLQQKSTKTQLLLTQLTLRKDL